MELGWDCWVVGAEDGYLMFVGDVGDFRGEAVLVDWRKNKENMEKAMAMNYIQVGQLAYQLLLGHKPSNPSQLQFPPTLKQK